MYAGDRDSDLIYLDMVPFRNNSWPCKFTCTVPDKAANQEVNMHAPLAPSDREVKVLIPSTQTYRQTLYRGFGPFWSYEVNLNSNSCFVKFFL